MSGGKPGNRGNPNGTGAPPSAIREHARGSFSDRIPILEAIADGQPIQRTRIRIVNLIPHVSCANCGEMQLAPTDPANVGDIEIEAVISASPRDRILAIDKLGEYGLGQLKEVSVETVKERMVAMIAVVREYVAPALFDEIRPRLIAAANGRR